MDESSHDADGLGEQDGLGRELPENNVEYSIFLIDDKVDGRKLLNQLESVRKAALELSQTLTSDYIWQRDDFNLQLRNEAGSVHSLTTSGLLS
jgi:hypothetical protein